LNNEQWQASATQLLQSVKHPVEEPRRPMPRHALVEVGRTGSGDNENGSATPHAFEGDPANHLVHLIAGEGPPNEHGSEHSFYGEFSPQRLSNECVRIEGIAPIQIDNGMAACHPRDSTQSDAIGCLRPGQKNRLNRRVTESCHNLIHG